MSNAPVPSVLFVCVKNGGKSQMAAGLMELHTRGRIAVTSAGTQPGAHINELSAQVLLEVGADIGHNQPKALTEQMMRSVDLVVVVGTEAKIPAYPGVDSEVWELDEPSLRGIEGRERMVLIRDELSARVIDLAGRLLPA